MTNAQQTAFVGTTGVLSTPDALIATPGAINYQYNNLMESRFDQAHTEGRNHIFALGLYPRFELGGRLTDFTPIGEKISGRGTLRGKRDLSGNAKLNLYQYDKKLWVSVGALDFGGLAQNFVSRYVVATANWKKLWFSAGVAAGDNASFDGGFANLHVKVNRYVSLQAELDTLGEANVGLSANIPLNAKLNLGASLSSSDNDVRIGMNISYRLGSSTSHNPAIAEGDAVGSDNNFASPTAGKTTDTTLALSELERALATAGFSNTRLGIASDKHYVVNVENSVFVHSDQEALDKALTLARNHLPYDADIEIALQHQGLVKSRFLFSADNDNADSINVKLPQTASVADTVWNVSQHKRDKQLAHISVQPELRTAVGTEFGVVDHTLGLRTGITIPLWSGASVVAAGILPLANSKNYDDGRPFAADRWDASLERAMLTQYLPVGESAHAQLELGEVQVRNFFYTAVKAQATWQSANYPLLLHASAAQYRLQDSPRQRDVILGTAAYTWPRFDTTISATYGQYFFGEHGVKLNASRRFGSAFVTLFAKVISSDDLAGGLQISTPIGPRKAFSWRGVSFSGVSRWSHALQTTIKFPDVSDNRIQPGFLLEPLLDKEIPRAILDSGRLNLFDVSHYFNADMPP